MTQTMYAENHYRAPEYSFPYQEQQRASGAFVVSKDGQQPTLDQDDLEKLRAVLAEQARVADSGD